MLYLCGMDYKRPIYNTLYQRLSEKGGLIQVISGPRQVGKIFNAAVIKEKQSGKPIVLAIDEIQKINNWSETIKLLYDKQ